METQFQELEDENELLKTQLSEKTKELEQLREEKQ